MKTFLRGYLNGWRRLFTERRFYIMFVLFLLFSFLGIGTYHQHVIRAVPVIVVDFDNSRISRTVRSYVAATREVQLVGDWLGSAEDAEQALVEGRAAAVVYIPSDFSDQIKRGREGKVIVAVDMSNILVGKNVLKAIGKSVGTVGAGVQLTTVRKLGERKDRALARVVPVVIEENFTFNPSTNYSVYLAPVLAFFLLNVYTLIAAASLLLPTPDKRKPLFLVGSLAAVASLSFALGSAIFFLVLPLEGIVAVSGATTVLVMVALLVLLDLAMTSSFFLFFRKPLPALQLTVVLGVLSLMFSGVTWPMDLFPPVIQTVARFIPFTPFAQAMRTFLHYPVTLAELSLDGFAFQAAFFTSLAIVGVAWRSAAKWKAKRASC